MASDRGAGEAIWLEANLRLVRADNPSLMTERGTNSYILGRGAVAIIDPGPDDPRHLEALMRALAPHERVSHILVTHSHRDHSGLAPALARRTGAPVLAFGPSDAGRDALLQARIAALGIAEGTGVHRDFTPDRVVAAGEIIAGSDWQVTALWTPGHMGNHLCYQSETCVFTGDHVMGWSSSVVAPPEGDMRVYIDALEQLRDIAAARFYPGHGPPIDTPQERVDALIRHRRTREAQILEDLAAGPADLTNLTARVYRETPPSLHAAARYNLLSHLLDLEARGIVTSEAPPHGGERYALAAQRRKER